MLIDSLNIQRFRGIPGSLQFDLSASLTVIYAPNGTGKTSVCDAVEWMLCGLIGRLNPFDENEVKCRFGENNLETIVEASFHDRNKPYLLKRILANNGSTLQRKIGAGEYGKVIDKELLGVLVDAMPPSGRSPKNQIAWVRSTRFLESDSLNLLIDSDEDSNNTRKLIFSNLFGVGDYQKAENDLNKILNKLPALSTIIREQSKIKKRISEYNETIKKLISEQGEPYQEHILNLLNTIAEQLETKVDIDKELSLLDHHKQLEVKFIKNIEALENEKASLVYIKENIGLYQENQAKIDELEKSFNSENILLSQLTDLNKLIIENRNKNQQVLDQHENIIIEITSALEELKITKAEFYHLYEIYKIPVVETENRLNELRDFVFSNERKICVFKENTLLVEKCIEIFPIWINLQDSIRGTSIEYESIQAIQSQDSNGESLPEQISDIKAKLDVLHRLLG